MIDKMQMENLRLKGVDFEIADALCPYISRCNIEYLSILSDDLLEKNEFYRIFFKG